MCFFFSHVPSLVQIVCPILSSRGFGFVTMGDEAGFNWVSSSQQHELRGKAVEIKAADGRR
jgi:hypothetical protein